MHLLLLTSVSMLSVFCIDKCMLVHLFISIHAAFQTDAVCK